MIALPDRRMSLSEFLGWWDGQPSDARFELVDGRVVAMGLDNVRHNRAKRRAASVLEAAIRAAGLDCEAFIDGVGVSPNGQNFRLPDALVHCGPLDPDASVVPNPVILVEIISPSSISRDAHEKLHDYFAIPSVAHYLIVYEHRGYVVHHRRHPSQETIETRFVSSGLVELSPPGLSVDVADFLT